MEGYTIFLEYTVCIYIYSWDMQYSYTVLNIEISGLLKLTSVINAIPNRIPVA